MTNSTIIGNTTLGFGGGLFAIGGTVLLTNCAVSGNSASSDGGGVLTELARRI